jgi:biopolymer transport protein ExbB
MLGLLGTVTGMMKSFSSLSKMGPSARDMLAQGITEALITTALGLLVAIPAIIFYNYMVSQIERFVREVEYISNYLNDLWK